jgi:hypothetical protein
MASTWMNAVLVNTKPKTLSMTKKAGRVIVSSFLHKEKIETF